MQPPAYEFVHDDGTVLASTRKCRQKRHASYKIACGGLAPRASSSSGEDADEDQLAKLKSDSTATEYTMHGPGVNPSRVSLWDDGRDDIDAARQRVRQQIASISYARTLIKKRSAGLSTYGPRTMACKVLHSPEEQVAEESTAAAPPSFMLHTKPPVWDASGGGGWALDFTTGRPNGPAALQSSKNFQLCVDDEQPSGRVAMQFAKVSKDTYTCDFAWPLSGLTAFGIALSTFEQKVGSAF